MRRYMNLARIDRIRRLGKVLTFGGLGLMVVALLVSLGEGSDLGPVIGLSMVGLLASQLGTVMLRRWPDRGRSDQILDAALKGLDARHVLIHYLAGARHALLTPRAALMLFPLGDAGRYEFRQGSFWRTPVRRDGRLGRPSALRGVVEQSTREAEALQAALGRRLPGRPPPEITPLIVFFHPDARLDLGDEAPPSVHLKKLKDSVRHLRRPGSLSETEIEQVARRFEALRRP